MATGFEERRASPLCDVPNVKWRTFSRKYKCKAWVYNEDEGGYSAVAARLPGVVGQGDSIEEALADLAEGFRLAVDEYLREGERIPWEEVDPEADAEERWIFVDVR